MRYSEDLAIPWVLNLPEPRLCVTSLKTSEGPRIIYMPTCAEHNFWAICRSQIVQGKLPAVAYAVDRRSWKYSPINVLI